MVIRTQDADAQPVTENSDGTLMIRFPYPRNEQPSIGLEFACSNSEFKRAPFVVYFDLVANGMTFQSHFLLKVSTNPARDSFTSSRPNQVMHNRILSCQSAFTPTSKRPRVLPVKSIEGKAPKRKEPTQNLQAERVNDVYTIEVS